MCNYTKTEHIAFAGIWFFELVLIGCDYFWSHVSHCSTSLKMATLCILANNDGKSKINNFGAVSILVENNILRFDISMNYMFCMTLFQNYQ